VVTSEQRYLSLLKRSLTRTDRDETWRPYLPKPQRRMRRAFALGLRGRLRRHGFDLVRREEVDPNQRALGRDRTPEGETMIGLRRLDHLQACICDVLAKGVPGDLIETGVWRGGAAIFMRAVLAACGDATRNVWVADSFAGLPPVDADRFPADRRQLHWTNEEPAVSLETVKRNFERYELLDERVRFLVGWFRDTLPAAPIDALSVLRLDGVTYESTLDALRPLYPKLSPGGYVIVDDWALEGCRRAVEDYRREHAISETLVDIDGAAVCWQKQSV
jgi:O-methyltransferase